MSVLKTCPKCGSDKRKTAKTIVLEGTTLTEGTYEGKMTERGRGDGIDAFFLSDRWFTYDKYAQEGEVKLSSVTGLAEEVRKFMVEHGKMPPTPVYPPKPSPPTPVYPPKPTMPALLQPPSTENPEYRLLKEHKPSRPWRPSPDEVKTKQPYYVEPVRRTWKSIFVEQMVGVMILVVLPASVTLIAYPEYLSRIYEMAFPVNLVLLVLLVAAPILIAALCTSPNRFYLRDLKRAKKKYERQMKLYELKLNFGKDGWDKYERELEIQKNVQEANKQTIERQKIDRINAPEVREEWESVQKQYLENMERIRSAHAIESELAQNAHLEDIERIKRSHAIEVEKVTRKREDMWHQCKVCSECSTVYSE